MLWKVLVESLLHWINVFIQGIGGFYDNWITWDGDRNRPYSWSASPFCRYVNLFEIILKLENFPSTKTLDGIFENYWNYFSKPLAVTAVLGKPNLNYKCPKRLMWVIIVYCLIISCPSVGALDVPITKKYVLIQENNR